MTGDVGVIKKLDIYCNFPIPLESHEVKYGCTLQPKIRKIMAYDVTSGHRDRKHTLPQ